GVDDVVAMIRARLRRQQRRQVEPVGSECRNVVDDGCRGVQVEGRPHLQPVRGAGNAHGVAPARDAATEWSPAGDSSKARNTTTDLPATESVDPASKGAASVPTPAVSMTTSQRAANSSAGSTHSVASGSALK